LKTRFDKWVKDELKELCEILDLEKGGDKVCYLLFIILFLIIFNFIFNFFFKKIPSL